MSQLGFHWDKEVKAVKTARQGAAVGLAFLIMALGLVLTMSNAEAASPRTVFLKVSNTGQTTASSSITVSTAGAKEPQQTFTTGSDGQGYILYRILFDNVSTNPARGDIDLTIHRGDGTKMMTLMGPDCSRNDCRFVSISEKRLRASTTYTIRLTPKAGSSVDFESTTSDDEDSCSVSGWSIGNTSTYKTTSDQTETLSGSRIFKLAIEADVWRRMSLSGVPMNLTAESQTHNSVTLSRCCRDPARRGWLGAFGHCDSDTTLLGSVVKLGS